MDISFPVLETAGTDYLERNRATKSKRLFMNYMMVMQFFVSAAGLALFGYYIGGKINPDSNLDIILTGIGLGLHHTDSNVEK